jgi:hypothetical protein
MGKKKYLVVTKSETRTELIANSHKIEKGVIKFYDKHGDMIARYNLKDINFGIL